MKGEKFLLKNAKWVVEVVDVKLNADPIFAEPMQMGSGASMARVFHRRTHSANVLFTPRGNSRIDARFGAALSTNPW